MSGIERYNRKLCVKVHTCAGGSVLSNRGLGIKAKKCLYERVIVPTALYGAEAYGV